jgi:hypothetical protein
MVPFIDMLENNTQKKKRTDKKSGFVALIAILAISIALFFVILTSGQRGISGRLMLLDVERKAQSEGLAEACVNVARIAIVNDPLYDAGETSVSIGNTPCLIISVEPNIPSSGESRIHAKGTVMGATTNIEAVVSNISGDVVLWRETPSF